MEEKRSLGRIFLDGIYLDNPVLSLFLGLTLAVLCTTTLEQGLFIAAIVLVDLVIVETVLAALRRWLGKYSSYVLALLMSACISVALAFVVAWLCPYVIIESIAPYDNVLINSLVPFIASSSLILCKGKDANGLTAGQAFFDSLGSGIGFLLAMALIGVVREILGTGEITFTFSMTSRFVIHITDRTFPIFLEPFGGLFMTGFFSGIHLGIVRRIKNRSAGKKALAEKGE